MKLWILVVIGIVVIAGCTTQAPVEVELSEEEQELGIQTLNDGTKYLIHPSELLSGGPPKDGIPSIDNPRFVSVEEADEWISDNELVMAIEHKGVSRVYPLQIMVWHEIVNDEIEGDPLLITFCPLCGSAIAFERTLDGEPVEFGVSGKLYNSDLVMYDRKTDTYWQQITGQAIVGPLTGQVLTPVNIETVTWRDWKSSHPDAEVLSRDTGFIRSYGVDPYGSRGYYENDNLFFPVGERDDRIHLKDVIFGIEVEGIFKAYREEDIIAHAPFEDTIGSTTLTVERSEDGTITFTTEDGQEIVKHREFWFAWYAFHTDTELYVVGSDN